MSRMYIFYSALYEVVFCLAQNELIFTIRVQASIFLIFIKTEETIIKVLSNVRNYVRNYVPINSKNSQNNYTVLRMLYHTSEIIHT